MRNLAIYGETIRYCTADDIAEFIKLLRVDYPVQKHKKKLYYNIPCAFDIETSSVYVDGEKQAFMYIWQLAIDDNIIIGRTWPEFVQVLESVSNKLGLNADKQLIVYVHNLAYEFQFMRKYLLWQEVFATDERKPVSALCSLGIRFKCSYLLTNLSLAGVGRNLRKYPVKKLVGDLDYSKVRTSATPLTNAELAYCINDIRVVMALIREKIEDEGGITKIPLTNTGYVRQYTRKECLYKYDKDKRFKRTQSNGYKYYKLIHSMTLSGAKEYLRLKRAFQGGFTHASVYNVGKVHKNVASFDITSSYPTVMIAEKFPMSKGFNVHVKSLEQFERLLKTYCCLFDIKYYGLRPKELYSENYLSESKCRNIKGAVYNNGRIAYADELVTTINEVDFEIIGKCYDFDSFAIGNTFTCYVKRYLPNPFIECILHFYEGKTTLKGVEGKEVEYMNLKGMLNSLYGMTVTDICRPTYVYNGEWSTEDGNIDELIEEYNGSKNRFMFYPWGIWVTAYARRNLFELILECKEDYIYSDTDSVKMLNVEKHTAFINGYNLAVAGKINKCLDFYGIPREKGTPRDIQGKMHVLGVFENETKDGNYLQFKTLGAKRYLYQTQDKKYHMTVAGLSKKTALKHIYRMHNYTVIQNKLKGAKIKSIMDIFDEDMYIPAGMTGKQTHTYIDEEFNGYIMDYLGNTAYVESLSSVHLEGAEYSLSITDAYVKFIKGYREIWSRQYDE